jgi:GGDEF domain-containing protein
MRARVSGKEIFAHDGIRDTLTHLAAPPYFYESLRRQISLCKRHGTYFSIIRLVIECRGSKSDEAILIFSEMLKHSFRYEDLIARTGLFEFALIFDGEEDLAETISRRFISRWCTQGIEGVTVSFATIEYQLNETLLSLLNRLDMKTLLSLEF